MEGVVIIELTLDKIQDTLFKCILHACNSFGVVPYEVLFDNIATVVDRTASTYRSVVINSKFSQFAKDVGFSVHTCRPYRSQTKGKIECVEKLMDRLKVYNEEFETIEELDKIVNNLMQEINNEDINIIEKPVNFVFFRQFCIDFSIVQVANSRELGKFTVILEKKENL